MGPIPFVEYYDELHRAPISSVEGPFRIVTKFPNWRRISHYDAQIVGRSVSHNKLLVLTSPENAEVKRTTGHLERLAPHTEITPFVRIQVTRYVGMRSPLQKKLTTNDPNCVAASL